MADFTPSSTLSKWAGETLSTMGYTYASTGSVEYGGYTHGVSDHDIVVRVEDPTTFRHTWMELCHGACCVLEPSKYFDGFKIHTGTTDDVVNLIPLPPTEYEGWILATTAMCHIYTPTPTLDHDTEKRLRVQLFSQIRTVITKHLIKKDKAWPHLRPIA